MHDKDSPPVVDRERVVLAAIAAIDAAKDNTELEHDVAGTAHLLPQTEFERVARSFVLPQGVAPVPETPLAAFDAPQRARAVPWRPSCWRWAALPRRALAWETTANASSRNWG